MWIEIEKKVIAVKQFFFSFLLILYQQYIYTYIYEFFQSNKNSGHLFACNYSIPYWKYTFILRFFFPFSFCLLRAYNIANSWKIQQLIMYFAEFILKRFILVNKVNESDHTQEPYLCTLHYIFIAWYGQRFLHFYDLLNIL